MQANYSISIVNSSNERWVRFIESHPETHIFHHPAWANLLSACYNHHSFAIAVEDPDRKIVAGLPMMSVNSLLTGRRWVSLPYTDHCCPIFDNASALETLNQALIDFSAEHGQSIEVRYSLKAASPIQTTSNHVLHQVDLESNPDNLLHKFHHTHQRNILKAQRCGVTIQHGETLEQVRNFYRLHLQTRRRQGVPVQPWKFFELLGKTLLERGLGFVLLAYQEDRCLAGAIFLHWQQTLTYKFGASTLEGQTLRPNNLLMWKAIEWGCENAYKIFDLGRTDISNEGLRRFKSGWGAEETQLIYSILSKVSPKPVNGRLTQFMHTVISSSPPWVCRIVGELLYKHFP